jgi:hypothetical protein
VGTVEQVVEALHGARDMGLAYANVNFADLAYDRGSAELFATRVIPELGN